MYTVDLHTHTIASTHAYSTLHDYIKYAKVNGIKLFAITDHGPDMQDAPHVWHFINMKTWPRTIDGIGILRGIEANIKNINNYYTIDCDDIMLKSIDLVIAGFHEPVFTPINKSIHTKAMIDIISSNMVQIISHPGNPKFPIDISEVAYTAAKHKVALEINNSSFIFSRNGSENNCKRIAIAVKNFGGYLAFGSDSHNAFNIGNFNNCIRIVNEVNFPKEKILNFTPRHCLNFLEMHGLKKIKEFSML